MDFVRAHTGEPRLCIRTHIERKRLATNKRHGKEGEKKKCLFFCQHCAAVVVLPTSFTTDDIVLKRMSGGWIGKKKKTFFFFYFFPMLLYETVDDTFRIRIYWFYNDAASYIYINVPPNN